MPIQEQPDEEEQQATQPSPEFIDSLLRDNIFPEKMKKRFGGFFDKETALTFLDERTAISILHGFDDTVVADLMGKAPTDLSFKEERDLNTMRERLKIKIARAKGGPRGIMNERTALMTQIQEQFQEGREEPRGGFLNTIKRAASRLTPGGG